MQLVPGGSTTRLWTWIAAIGIVVMAGCEVGPSSTSSTSTPTTRSGGANAAFVGSTTSAITIIHSVAVPSNPSAPVGDSAWRSKAYNAFPDFPHAAARAAWAFASPYGSGPWLIPEYNDEQRLYEDATSSSYGPVARAFASPYLSALKRLGHFNAYGDSGALVGVIDVEPEPNPAAYPFNGTYERLGITATGTYCVWLANTGTNPVQNWRAYIRPVDAAGHCQPATTGAVAVTAIPGGSNNPNHYVSTMRFAHDNDMHPILLVQCLRALCEIGTPSGHPPRPVQGGQGNQWKKVWFDEQRLATRATASAPYTPTGIVAALQPEPDLDTRRIEYYQCPTSPCSGPTVGWKKVATLTIAAGAPLGKYGDPAGANLATGNNEVWLRRNGPAMGSDNGPNSSWDVRIVNNGVVRKTILRIKRHGHWDMVVPGTARFKFFGDEGLWVSCGMGCCEVDLQ